MTPHPLTISDLILAELLFSVFGIVLTTATVLVIRWWNRLRASRAGGTTECVLYAHYTCERCGGLVKHEYVREKSAS